MSQNNFTRLVCCEIKCMRPIFTAKMLFFQSKANLDEKILFGKITRHSDPEIRKMLVRGMYWNNDSTFHFGPFPRSISDIDNVRLNAT